MSTLVDDRLLSIAQKLDDAARFRIEIDTLRTDYPFSLDEAYLIQRASITLREARGEKAIGLKLGFTSRAKMIQMGVDSLIWGWLTDAMLYEEGGVVDLAEFIHSRAEPEVCFLTSRDIDRPLNLLEVASYIEGVAPAMELIDSRYRNFKFTLEDVVADNCSSAGLVIGAFSSSLADLGNCGVTVRMDGRVQQIGSTGAILGNPLRSIVQASQLVHRAGLVLPAGSMIMAGAATAAVALAPGVHVCTEIAGLGRVEFLTGATA